MDLARKVPSTFPFSRRRRRVAFTASLSVRFPACQPFLLIINGMSYSPLDF